MDFFDNILYEVTKPARYSGGEWNSVVKDWDKTRIHFALAYPDVYEVGMSALALPILYEILNAQPDTLAERVYAPWVDMEKAMRNKNLPLFSLESKHPLKDFDIIGFSLGYELAYTNILNMLDLAGVPLFSRQRKGTDPIIIAGGTCSLNPEPIAEFIDFFVLGDGEEVVLEFLETFRNYRNLGREKILREAAKIRGIYVPSLYEIDFHDGVFNKIIPKVSEAKPSVERRIVTKLPPPVTKPVVPYIEVIHDRGAVEIQRGCSRGCRFCQAGVIYRPVRERSQKEVVKAVDEILKNCGYREISLLSLSTSDYQGIEKLMTTLLHRYNQDNLTFSLPSLHPNTSLIKLIESFPSHRKFNLTLAPEAGSERLRKVINKRLPEEVLLDTVATGFDKGISSLKLYFMVGLPMETMDDIFDILNLVSKICHLRPRRQGKQPRIKVSIATFVPKPHTPFQWAAQEGRKNWLSKYEALKKGLQKLGVNFSWHDPRASELEAVLSRGDRRVGQVIYRAWCLGCKFDAWSEHFNYDNWRRAFQEEGLDPNFYSHRAYSLDEPLPWAHIDVGINESFLKQENEQALREKETPDCRYEPCNKCGLQRWQPACSKKCEELATS